MDIIRKRNKKARASDSVNYRRQWLGQGEYDTQLLYHCYHLWNNLEGFRERRARALRWIDGDQWGDMITVKGKTMLERDYITNQGNVALQANQLKRLVETIAGSYVKQQNEPVCKARAREEQVYGELMSTCMKANWQINDMPIVIDTSIKEVLGGGLAAVRESYENRSGELDTWTDCCHPNYLFFDSTMKDPRYYDMELIGEIHDISFGRFCEKFAHSPEDIEKFAKWYADASSPMYASLTEDVNDKHNTEEMTFFAPKDRNLCRVYEVWRKESRDRYRVHDENTGELYIINADDKETIAAINLENKKRKALAAEQGWSTDEIPLIRYKENFFVDTYWYGRFLTPQGYVLWEGESPYTNRKCPYTIIILPMTDGKIVSYISDAIDQNRYINRMLTLYDWMQRAGLKGVTYVPKNSIPDDMTEEEFAEQLTSIDGIVFYEPRKDGVKPETFYGHTGTINLAEIVRMMKELMESGTSVSAAIRGEQPKSGTAAALYAQQTENSATPLASLMMRFGVFVRNIAKLKLCNIQQFYTPERYEQIAGQMSQLVDTASVNFRLAGNLEYDLSVVQSTATPTFRAFKTDVLMQFAQAGFIPPRFVFEFGDIPGADEILQRLDAMQQESADQQVGPGYAQAQAVMTSPEPEMAL
jgi:hypothetical protein